MALQTQRQVSLPWGGGAASDGCGRVPEPEGETVPTARDSPLEDPDHALCLPLLPLPVPFSLGFPGCLFSHLYSLSSFSGFAP